VAGPRFDDLDRRLLHALQVDGRAPFRRIGEVLGVSDQTVARRYARLRAARALRVLAMGDPSVFPATQWLLRLRAAPAVAGEIAQALSARADSSWVSLCAGGTEIYATVYGDGIDPPLLEAIPRTRQVLDVQADRVLHVFYGGAGEPYAKHGPLTAEQVERLAAHVPARVARPATVDRTDRRLLDLLRDDGRARVDDLATATGTAPATVRRRLRDLRAGGALHFDVDVDAEVLDLALQTLVRWSVAPQDLDAAGRALAAHAEVAFAAATTGSTNLCASVASADAAELYRYLTGPAAGLPGVREIHTTPVLRTVKAAATRYGVSRDGHNGRLGVGSSRLPP
jgi:DNA-binding Lrp family transcriptional regulator